MSSYTSQRARAMNCSAIRPLERAPFASSPSVGAFAIEYRVMRHFSRGRLFGIVLGIKVGCLVEQDMFGTLNKRRMHLMKYQWKDKPVGRSQVSITTLIQFPIQTNRLSMTSFKVNHRETLFVSLMFIRPKKYNVQHVQKLNFCMSYTLIFFYKHILC